MEVIQKLHVCFSKEMIDIFARGPDMNFLEFLDLVKFLSENTSLEEKCEGFFKIISIQLKSH